MRERRLKLAILEKGMLELLLGSHATSSTIEVESDPIPADAQILSVKDFGADAVELLISSSEFPPLYGSMAIPHFSPKYRITHKF